MPVYAYDVPPHLYVRLAPQIGADLAVVGPLSGGAYEQLLGEPTLFGGLQQSMLVQVLLDLSRCPDLSSQALRWLALSFAPGLAGGGTRALALVLPQHAAALVDELQALAAQHCPALALAYFPDAASAIFWLATRIPGVGSYSTPDEVRREAAAGRWVEAVARYRALTASSLAVAVEVVEGLLREGVRTDVTEPSSLIPSTEQPPEDKNAPLPVILPAEPAPEPAPEPALEHGQTPVSSSGASSVLPTSSPTATQASLGQVAETAARLATVPTQFQDELTTARGLDDSLFLSDEVVAEEEFLGSRLRDIEPMLRGTLSRIWFAPSEDGETLLQMSVDEGRGIEVHEESREDAPMALEGARLDLLLRDGFGAIRFGPGSPAEITLRRHQLPLAREVLSGLLVEGQLDQLPGDPHARERCLNHRFLVLIDRSDPVDRVLILPGVTGREALLFTLPDILVRYLQRRPEALASRRLGILTEQGDSLLEKLLVLPLDGVVINPGGPAETWLTRAQLKEVLYPGGRSLPPEAAPIEAVGALASEEPPPSVSTVVAPASYGAPASSASSVSSAAVSLPSAVVSRRFIARSLVEAHFYLDIRGFERQERYQWREVRGEEILWMFLVKGPGGQQEQLEFSVLVDTPAAQDGYFGPGPSPLLGPVELIQRAGAMIRASSETPLGLLPDELAQATHAAEMAYILVMEALRHYGNEDVPPAASLKTDEERLALAREPERFQRARVEELARSYWYIATQLGEALRGKP